MVFYLFSPVKFISTFVFKSLEKIDKLQYPLGFILANQLFVFLIGH